MDKQTAEHENPTEHLLGPRLQAVAAFVPQGACLGDIGTDHAYLPITLYTKGLIKRTVAVDVHKGPYLSAFNAVRVRGLGGGIDVRLGDGLAPVGPGEVDTLTMAGMGGRTILDILAAGPQVLKYVNDLILQPQGLESGVRQHLLNEGWRLRDECLVEEDGRIYVVMAFSRLTGWGSEEIMDYIDVWIQDLLRPAEVRPGSVPVSEPDIENLAKELFWQFGPLIWQRANDPNIGSENESAKDLLSRQLAARQRDINKRLNEMQNARSPEVELRCKQFRGEAVLLEKLICRLKQGK